MIVQENAVYGKVPYFIHVCREGKSERMSCRLITPNDKVYRDDVLFEAWKRVEANKGSSGVDGIKIEDVEAMGIEKYLSEIKSELMNGKYKPSPVKRVMIPKPDGSERPLGIPTVKDRIVQMATKIAIEHDVML